MTARLITLSLALALVLGVAPCRAQTAPPPAAGFTGKVVETMNAATYTYVLVDDGTRRIWAAGPQTTVAVGDHVDLPPGMVMRNFASKSLGRTFEEIQFVGAIRVAKGSAPAPAAGAAAPAPPGHAVGGAVAAHAAPALGGAKGAGTSGAAPHAGSPHAAAGDSAAPVSLDGIPKAEGGQTVAEILAGKADGAGKPVLVRGRVVKYTAAVMGKNWLHIQDGSGAGADLTVTTAATAKVGDTVLVRGTLATDRDFGAGYQYDAIVEDAAVTVE